MMDIPKVVIDKADCLVDSYGCHFKHLGLRMGKEMYQFVFPENERTGFPFLYLYDKYTDTAEEITGIKALKLLQKSI